MISLKKLFFIFKNWIELSKRLCVSHSTRNASLIFHYIASFLYCVPKPSKFWTRVYHGEMWDGLIAICIQWKLFPIFSYSETLINNQTCSNLVQFTYVIYFLALRCLKFLSFSLSCRHRNWFIRHTNALIENPKFWYHTNVRISLES